MSCIRRLFSRKNLRSVSSETILVNGNRGSDSSTSRPGGSVAAAQNVASTDSNCSDGDVGQSSRTAQRKRLVAEGKALSSATGTINIKPSPTLIEEIKRPECTSTQSVPAKVRALSVDARASSFKPQPRSASCSFSSLRRVARRRRKEETHRERSPSAGQEESVGTVETQRILSTKVAADAADRAITSTDLATLVGKDVLDATKTSQNTPEKSNVHSSVIAKAASLGVHVPNDTYAVKNTTKNIRTASERHEEEKTAVKVAIKIEETYHEKGHAASGTAGTLSVTPKDTQYPADNGSLTTVCSASRIPSIADPSTETQSSESSNAAQTVNDPSSEAATTAAQYYHTDTKTSSDELSYPSVSISNAVSEIIIAATRESCSAFNVLSGDIVEYQGTGAADQRTKEETKTPCLECSRERKQALKNLHVDDPGSAASLLSHSEQQRDAKCIVPFTALTVHQTILAYTCSRRGDVTHPPLSRSPPPPPAPPLPPSLARQACPQANFTGASITSTSSAAPGGSSQPGPSNVIEVCALLHETRLPPVNSITIEKQRSNTSQPGSLDSQQKSEINPDTPRASQDASTQQSPEGTAQELRSESFPSTVPAADRVENETGEPTPRAEDLATENSRTGTDTDSTCTCSNRTTAEGSSRCPLHPRISPDTAEMDGETHSAPFDPAASSRAQPQSDAPNNMQPVATSAMERTPPQAQPGTLFDRVLSPDFQAEFRDLAPSAPPAEPAFSSQFNLLAYTQEIETDQADNVPASSQRRSRSESVNTPAPHVESATSSQFDLLAYTQETETDQSKNDPASSQRRSRSESVNTPAPHTIASHVEPAFSSQFNLLAYTQEIETDQVENVPASSQRRSRAESVNTPAPHVESASSSQFNLLSSTQEIGTDQADNVPASSQRRSRSESVNTPAPHVESATSSQFDLLAYTQETETDQSKNVPASSQRRSRSESVNTPAPHTIASHVEPAFSSQFNLLAYTQEIETDEVENVPASSQRRSRAESVNTPASHVESVSSSQFNLLSSTQEIGTDQAENVPASSQRRSRLESVNTPAPHVESASSSQFNLPVYTQEIETDQADNIPASSQQRSRSESVNTPASHVVPAFSSQFNLLAYTQEIETDQADNIPASSQRRSRLESVNTPAPHVESASSSQFNLLSFTQEIETDQAENVPASSQRRSRLESVNTPALHVEPAFSSQFNLLAYTQEIETDQAENVTASSQRRSRSESVNTPAPHVKSASSSLFNLLSHTQEIDPDHAQNVPAPSQRPEAESSNTSNGFFCQYLESKDPETNASKSANAKNHDSPLACMEENQVRMDRGGEASHLNAMSYQPSAFPMSFLASIVNTQDNHHDHQAAQTMEPDALQEVRRLQDSKKSLNTKAVEEKAGSDTASSGPANNSFPIGSDERDMASSCNADNSDPSGSDEGDMASSCIAHNSDPSGSDVRHTSSLGNAHNSDPSGSGVRHTASSGKADDCDPSGSGERDTDESQKRRMKLADRRRRIEESGGEEGEETLTVAGLLDVFDLEELMNTNKAQLRSSYKRLRKEKNRAAILEQYVVHQSKEQAELSRLIGMIQAQGTALKEERKNKDAELQKICDLMECEDEGNARKHEPLMYKKYCAAKTSAEAKTLLSTIRHRQRALHFLEAMTYRKCVALELNLKIEVEKADKAEKAEEQKRKNSGSKTKQQIPGPPPPKKPRKIKDLASFCSTTTTSVIPLNSAVGPSSAGSASTGTVALPSQQQQQQQTQQQGNVSVFSWPSTGNLVFDEVFETDV